MRPKPEHFLYLRFLERLNGPLPPWRGYWWWYLGAVLLGLQIGRWVWMW